MRTFHHDQDRQFPRAGQLRGARLVELSKIAHRDAEVLEANPEVAPDNEAHHAGTKLSSYAIVVTHFTGMGAVLVMPDPARVNGATSVSPASLSLVIAGVAAIILGLCLAAALSDRQSKGKLRQQKILLDTALENMSQGLCMLSTRMATLGRELNMRVTVEGVETAAVHRDALEPGRLGCDRDWSRGP
jgi:hypothetical protein